MSSEADIAVAMFTVADQDSAIAFYTGTLGWAVRTDVNWGRETTPGGGWRSLPQDPRRAWR